MDKLVDRDAVGELLSQKLPHAEIAEIEGCSISSVAMVSRELGMQTRRNTQYVVMDEVKWERLLGLYKTGEWTVTQLASLYGVSRANVYKRIYKANLKR